MPRTQPKISQSPRANAPALVQLDTGKSPQLVRGLCKHISLYLKLVSFPADAASQTWFFYKFLHLFKQRSLGHYLTLLIRLKERTTQAG